MSDGREEREQQEQCRRQRQQKNRRKYLDDRLNRDLIDPFHPNAPTPEQLVPR